MHSAGKRTYSIYFNRLDSVYCVDFLIRIDTSFAAPRGHLMLGLILRSSFRFRMATTLLLALIAGLSTGCDEKIRSSATPTVEVVPQRFVFTKVQVGTDDDRTVEIKNIGTGDLLISSVAFVGDNDDAEFGLYYKRTREARWNGSFPVSVRSTGWRIFVSGAQLQTSKR